MEEAQDMGHQARPDPRVAARREAVERDAAAASARRRRIAFVGAATAALAIVGGVAAMFSPALAVKEIQVLGARQTPVEAVVSRSGVRPGSPLVRVRTGDVRARVTALPWVASVEVRRRWPSSVVIKVTERVPVAVIAAESGAAEVAEDGRVLKSLTSLDASPSLILVMGANAPGKPGSLVGARTRRALLIVTSFDARVRPLVRRITLRDQRVIVWLGDAAGRQTAVEFDPFGAVALEQRALATLVVRMGADRLVARTAVIKLDVPDAPVLTPRQV